MSFDFYMNWKSIKWGLHSYILLTLEINIVGKIVGIKLGFCRIRYTLQKITRDLIYLTTGHMIHEYTSGKAHIN